MAARIISFGSRQGNQPSPICADPAQGRLDVAADPDGDGALHRQRIDPGGVDALPLPFEVDDRGGPEGAQECDLLLAACAAVGELLVQPLVLDLVPADADAEPHPPAAEDVDLGGLLGDQDCLPLGQDDHAGH